MMDDLYSQREVVAIEQLQDLAKRWPETLMLFASAGALYVLRKSHFAEGLDLDEDGVAILGISCDGGVGDL